MAKGKLFVGTSGWSYKHWLGVLYAEGLAQRKWLERYAEVFPTVELNVTYYRIPKASVFEGWRKRTPGGFRFAVKTNKQITHKKRLVDCGEVLDWFLEDSSALGAKFGPLLVQLPPSFKKDASVLDGFLRELRKHPRGRRRRVAIEFRDESWLTDEVFEILRKRRAAVCFADHPKCGPTDPATADFIYVRRHGPGGRYRANYPEEMLRPDATLIGGHLKAGRDAFVYFNNDIEGHAVRNAARLTQILTGRPPARLEPETPTSLPGIE